MGESKARGFSENELDYYSRQMVLPEIGVRDQGKLKGASACLVGVGGLGSTIAVLLASMGVGRLRLVDMDVVEISNLQRQHLYTVDDVGYPKVEAATTRLRSMNPFIEIEPVPMAVTPSNVGRLVDDVDVIVDGLDRMAPRYSLNRACVEKGIPLVYGAVITGIGNATTIIPGETACLECFQGSLDDEALPTCAVAGVHPSIIKIVASIQVSEAVRLLLGRPPLLMDNLIFCDLEDLSFEKIKLARVENCPVCGSRPRSEPPPIRHEPVQEICGREGRRVFVFATDEDLGIDLKHLKGRLSDLGYKIDVNAGLGTTFSKGAMKGSVLKSGVTILEGVGTKVEATGLRDILLGSKGT